MSDKIVILHCPMDHAKIERELPDTVPVSPIEIYKDPMLLRKILKTIYELKRKFRTGPRYIGVSPSDYYRLEVELSEMEMRFPRDHITGNLCVDGVEIVPIVVGKNETDEFSFVPQYSWLSKLIYDQQNEVRVCLKK